jgi:hypothetical protein
MKCFFPDYHVDSDDEVDGKKDVWGVGNIINDFYRPLVINKGYVCIKEASITEDGTILHLHDGKILAYKEKYRS